MSHKTPKAVYTASERQYTAAGEIKYLSRLPRGGIHELRKSEQKGINSRITKANVVLRELCCSVVKTGAFKDRKAFSF